MAAMKESTKKVIEYLQQHTADDLTALDVSEALNLTKRQVDGIFTSAIQRKNFGYREEGERDNEDGTHDKVKFLRLNEQGLDIDTSATDAE